MIIEKFEVFKIISVNFVRFNLSFFVIGNNFLCLNSDNFGILN